MGSERKNIKLTKTSINDLLTLRWSKGDSCHPPKVFSRFSSEWGELLFQNNFVAVGTSLGDLVALKLDKGRVLGEWRPPSTHEL